MLVTPLDPKGLKGADPREEVKLRLRVFSNTSSPARSTRLPALPRPPTRPARTSTVKPISQLFVFNRREGKSNEK